MTIPLIIVYSSIVLWVLPPFKQYRTKYFSFFLFLAISDPIKLALYKLFHIGYSRFAWVFILLLISALVDDRKIKKVVIGAAIVSIIISLTSSIDRLVLMYISLLLHIIIWILLVNGFITRFSKDHCFNLFLSVLVLYESVNILKYISALLSYESGAFSYYMGTVSQFFFAILFCVVNVNTKDYLLTVSDA